MDVYLLPFFTLPRDRTAYHSLKLLQTGNIFAQNVKFQIDH